jgi:hypothetical protein
MLTPTDFKPLQKNCGDGFIRTIGYGAKVIVTMSLEFEKAEGREAFQKEFGPNVSMFLSKENSKRVRDLFAANPGKVVFHTWTVSGGADSDLADKDFARLAAESKCGVDAPYACSLLTNEFYRSFGENLGENGERLVQWGLTADTYP